MADKPPVIDLLGSSSSSSSDEEDPEYDPRENTTTIVNQNKKKPLNNPYRKTAASTNQPASSTTGPKQTKRKNKTKKKPPPSNRGTGGNQPLQAGLVLEEDVTTTSAAGRTSSPSVDDDDDDDEGAITAESYSRQQQERKAVGQRALLFHDKDFETVPSSIEGQNKKDVIKCRCRGSLTAKLSYKTRGRGGGGDTSTMHPYYHCANNKCNYFKWAFQAEKMQWYRFGSHTGHRIVNDSGFSANDLSQGRVGDCWFLSALAVVAERPDLILRLFGNGKFTELNEYGVVQVNLFLDGYWKTVTMDNFLPCLVDGVSESQLQQALQASVFGGGGVGRTLKDGAVVAGEANNNNTPSSNYDPYVVSDKCKEVLHNTHEFLEKDQARRIGGTTTSRNSSSPRTLQRPVTSDDLAYSKAKANQLWVPYLEKAYAKSHGCYQAISGGHIAEAFLDLTGAPTLVYNFDSKDFHPRSFWSKLLQYRQQRLPMGCGTSSSAAGIIGMHAYSILDVREVKNVSYRFFQETGVAHGNVSGFTEFDGKVRLLRIRNPHGKGEWKQEFSDNSPVWEKLLQHQEQQPGVSSSPGLQRTMKNDGTFWIDYDNFCMGFSNVDVVLAFLGNHAKSFTSNFPAKKSNHRCARAFEVSLLDPQPGIPSRDTVEMFCMGIQKTRRGARSGRADRRVSYKVCDLGMLVGENRNTMGCAFDDEEDDNNESRDNMDFPTVKGQMFGFSRNGHYRLVLDRKKNKRLVVMPISFGHPAATDKELSFVLRFVSDAPLLIRELPHVPRMDSVIQKFLLSRHAPQTKQGVQKVLLQDPTYRMVQVSCLGNGGGVVFLYLCVNEDALHKQGLDKSGLAFSVEASCRGMTCRTEDGLLQHETVAKGKKFEASWRRFKAEFAGETRSRLLLVLYQSGQDTEFGAINCKRNATSSRKLGGRAQQSTMERFLHHSEPGAMMTTQDTKYNERGIFNGVAGTNAFELSGNLANYSTAAAFGQMVGFQEGIDDELERALAISRGDMELQQALERSSRAATGNHNSSNFNADLQRALALSKAEAGGGNVASGESSSGMSYTDPSLSYDDALSKAVQLSMKESRQPSRPNAAADNGVVDLTEEDSVPAKRKKTGGDDAEVVVLDDDTKESAEDQKEKSAGSAEKRRKTNTSDDEVVVLDNDTEVSVEEKKEETIDSLAEKRKLAAEAAMKRFGK